MVNLKNREWRPSLGVPPWCLGWGKVAARNSPLVAGFVLVAEGLSAIYGPLGHIFAGLALIGFTLTAAYLRGSLRGNG